MIDDGHVRLNGNVATKSATQVEPTASIAVQRPDGHPDYASRGAFKLAGALDALGVDPTGLRCLDAGASTGGFTDVLLRRGATQVVAADVGYGQLVWALQQDPRVVVRDRTNVRNLTVDDIDGPVDLVVADLSFISLRLVIEALGNCVHPAGRMLLMVKPQFEVGKERLGSGGVVRDSALRAETVTTIADYAAGLGWGVDGVTASTLPGPSGNVEYFLLFRRGAPALDPEALQTAIAEGPQ